MNLKDRLDNIKNTNQISIKEEKRTDIYFDINNIFVNYDKINGILCSIINQKKNIIFISDNSVDKNIVVSLMQSVSGSSDIEILNSIDENIYNSFTKIKFISDSSIIQIVKIFEYIIYGYSSFISLFNLANDENIINKLKTVIAVNFRNLTEENINTLIGCSDSFFVSIEKDEDGLFLVSKVQKINYIENIISLDVIYDYKNADKNVEQKFVEEAKPENSEEDNSYIETEKDILKNDIQYQETDFIESEDDDSVIQNEQITIDINEEKNEENLIDTTDNVEEKPIIKVNKYRLLKEKIKNKRNK